jgi:hypothetical protein
MAQDPNHEENPFCPLTKFWRSLVRFDLVWYFDRLSKIEHKSKRTSWDLNPFFRDFLVLGLCNRYRDVGPWVYPCLGPFCNV